jgi:hypothetical protein
MDRQEIAWRARAAGRTAIDRVAFHIRRPRWNRADLLLALTDAPALASARTAIERSRCRDAHAALSRHFADRRSCFVIAPAQRQALADAIRSSFPDSARDAARRADRIVAGRHDLLGYRDLSFDGWHSDPVHARTAPTAFWADVPYLDPSCGDHKIIWERNRHQHALSLGRAFWLTGDRRYRDAFVADLESWLDANPPLSGINWASMLELALRSLSWIWALHFFAADGARDDAPWIADLLLGIDRQLTHVERNLSYYFSPNTHLLGEALALYVAGCTLPELSQSARWQAMGRRVLVQQIDRQIAPDGGHCERSTHYHRYTLDFYMLALAVARASADTAAPAFERAVARLAHAARLLSDDAGRAPHIGDDDGGMLAPLCGRAADDWRDSLAIAAALTGRSDLAIGAPPEEAWWWLGGNLPAPDGRTAVATAPPSAALVDTGYYVSRSPRGDHLVLDAGPHGYQNGGHAHADALSLTYTVAGVPLLIDCGTGSYTINPDVRDRFRSTARHNTLEIDGRSQSIPGGPFHWSQVATGAATRWRTNDAFDYFQGEHDGYGPSRHRRHVLVFHGDILIVADLVADLDGASGRHRAAVYWHVDPRWEASAGVDRALFTRNGQRVELRVAQGSIDRFHGDTDSGLGWYSPVYGVVEPATTLRVTHAADVPFWIVSVFGLNPGNALQSVDVLPVWAEAGVLRSALGVRIVRDGSIDHLLIAESDSSSRESSWRLAEFETDAHLLLVRMDSQGAVARVAMVDGSRVRSASKRTLELSMPEAVTDVHLDVRQGARLTGHGNGARVVVNGVELTVAPERRVVARARGSRPE